MLSYTRYAKTLDQVSLKPALLNSAGPGVSVSCEPRGPCRPDLYCNMANTTQQAMCAAVGPGHACKQISALGSLHRWRSLRQYACALSSSIAGHVRMEMLAGALAVSSSLHATCASDHATATIQPWSLDQNRALGTVSAVDAYADRDMLHVLVAGQTDRPTMFYLRTQGKGDHWLPAVTLPTGNATPVSRRGNDVQIVAHGSHVLALWQTQGELPGMGPILSAYSDDAGQTWHKGPSPADSQATDQSHMDAVADTMGSFHLVWLDDRQELGNYQGLRYARSDDYGRHWQHYATLDDTTCTCCWTRLAIAPNARIFALYRDGTPHDMALSSSSNSGLDWQPQGAVGAFGWEFQGCPHAGGGLTVAPDGGLFSLVWTGKQGSAGLHFMKSVDFGKTWQAQMLSDPGAVHADVAALNANLLIALWDSRSADGNTVRATWSCDGGREWSKATVQSDPRHTASHPRVVATRQGVFGFWTERAPTGQTQLAFYR